MAYNDIFEELLGNLFDELFQELTDPLDGKFVDQNGVYEFKNGSSIKIIDNNPEDNFIRGHRAKIMMQDDDHTTQELIDEVLPPFRGV